MTNERFLGFLAHYGFDYKDTNGYALANCFRIRQEDAIRLFEAMESSLRAMEPVMKDDARTYQELAEHAHEPLEQLTWQTQCDRCGNKSCIGIGRNLQCPCGGTCRDIGASRDESSKLPLCNCKYEAGQCYGAEEARDNGHQCRAEKSGVFGYQDAFYKIAEVLGMPAMPVSPKEAFETVMLPKLRALRGRATVPIDLSDEKDCACPGGLAEHLKDCVYCK